MSTAYDIAVANVRRALDGRRLIWMGIRGEDGEALQQLPELSASYSIIAPMRGDGPWSRLNVCLEVDCGVRPDLDCYDVDLDAGEHVREFRRGLQLEVGRSCCVVVPYRSSTLLSNLAFSMAETTTLAGMLRDRQCAFEHKPWVERSLQARGLAGLGWRYVADEHRARAVRLLDDGPQILRPARASGGVGIGIARNENDIDRQWPTQADTFVSVAPFLEPSTPVNFSGCVFDDGSIRLHPPSLQLIGVPSCSDRPFGYCGNDFAATSALEHDLLIQMDAMGRQVGAWLFEERYRGAFGVDALIYAGRLRFVEVNARFQGSSALSAEIARELGVPDLFLDHLAALLGMEPSAEGLTMVEWASRQPPRTRIVVHNTTGEEVFLNPSLPHPSLPGVCQIGQLVADGVRVHPGAVLGSLTVERSVSSDGFEIDTASETLIATIRDAFCPTAAMPEPA